MLGRVVRRGDQVAGHRAGAELRGPVAEAVIDVGARRVIGAGPVGERTRAVAVELTVDATLEIGQTSEQVSVVGDVQQVETSTSALGRVVEQQLVTALPLSSRNFTQILALSPQPPSDHLVIC